jgi:nucleoside-diphosphate-sugar epimerase
MLHSPAYKKSGRVLVTGSNGFVGGALCEALRRSGHQVVQARHVVPNIARHPEEIVVTGTVGPKTEWSKALTGVNQVVHLAARVHVMRDLSTNSLAEFRTVNVAGTLNLARQAAAAGVGRLVYMSSVKVNGEATLPMHAFKETDPPSPKDAYGISKDEAEQGLRKLATQVNMEIVIIRPPLVYGPEVRANFAALMRAVRAGWPLPLGAIKNSRSLVGLDNLVDFTTCCLRHPLAANETFLVSDGHDLSTPELIRRLADAGNLRARLLPVPTNWLSAGASLIRKSDALHRLCGDLKVDISKAKQVLNWSPPFSVDEGLRRTMNFKSP